MKTKKKKLLLIGWDAADWKFLTPLMDEGLMPNLSRLVESGVKGKIATLDPPLSPTLWTSIATGKRPYKHGIHGFAERRPDGKGIRPIYNTNRKVKALWNIFTEHNLKSNVVSWWPSHPGEKINGVMVSNFFQRANSPVGEEWPMVKGTVYPPEKEKLVAALRVHPGELTEAHILPFVPEAHKIDQTQDQRLQSIAKITADCASVQSAATYLLENEEWDFSAVYFDGIDHYCHGFMKFNPPYRPHIPRKDYELYKDVVKGACLFHDMMLGKLMKIAGEDAHIMLISDHGFHPDHNRPINLPKEPAGPAYEHSPYGIIVMKGPDFKKDELVFGASLLDITPTILHFFGLPVGRDMDGKVLTAAFQEKSRISYIDSWESNEEYRPLTTTELTPEQEEIELKQLIALGYIDDPGDDYEKAINDTENENNFYLARAFFDGGKWQEGVDLLEILYADQPKEARFGIRLIHGYQVMGNFSKARKVLEEIREYLQTDFMELDMMEGSLFLAENKPKKALSIFSKLKEEVGVNPTIDLKIATSFIQLNEFQSAAEILNQVILNDPENQEAFFKLGFCKYHQGDFVGASQRFLDSIGLAYYNPSAHYYLAEALFSQEQYEEAAEALETCLKLAPGMNVARQRLISIYNQFLKQPGRAIKYQLELGENYQGEITVVSGLPRSGTSMMMQMLEAGGFEIFTDKKRIADESNPNGYYEHEAVKAIAKNKKWLPYAVGKTVKVVAQLLPYLPSKYNYKIVFMERDLMDVINSQQRMISRKGQVIDQETLPLKLYEDYKKTLTNMKGWAHNRSNVDIHYVNYDEVVNEPFLEAIKIAEFLKNEIDPEQMIKAVQPSLRRENKKIIL